jgi:hypothetical protein
MVYPATTWSLANPISSEYCTLMLLKHNDLGIGKLEG